MAMKYLEKNPLPLDTSHFKKLMKIIIDYLRYQAAHSNTNQKTVRNSKKSKLN